MKLKHFLAIGAMVCLIVLGALLPELTARRQDAQSEGKIQFSQVESVKLEFSRSDMTCSETLAILSHSLNAVEIPRELASLKYEKVEKIAASAAEKYRDAGILLSEPGGDVVLYCQSVLYYGRDNQSNVYWQVHYGAEDGGYRFNMFIDDRTGTICSMEYLDTKTEYEPERMEEVLQGFCRLYLTGLGEEFFDYSVEELMDNAKSPRDQSYLATELSWDDPLYGENRITFFVNRGGFYTYFG